MFDAKQLREWVIKTSLQPLDLWSVNVENLLVMLAAHESNGGNYLKQIDGPALGLYGMEPATYNSLWARFLNNGQDKTRILVSKIMLVCNFQKQPEASELLTNLKLATIMARVFFLPVREPFPAQISDLSVFAKKYWNTELGKATPEKYESDYYRLEGIGIKRP